MMEEREKETGLETRNIFFDTQVFRSYGHNLNAKPLKVVRDYISDGIFVLHTTDVTLMEISAQLDTMQNELVSRANKISREIERWNTRHRRDVDLMPVQPQFELPSSPTHAFRDFEWTLKHDWSVVQHEAAKLTIGPILDQYFSRHPPFDRDGSKEFPDAMAIHALDTWCEDLGEKCYLVSKDKAVQRAAEQSSSLIAIPTLDELLSILTSGLDHSIAEKVMTALSAAPLFEELEECIADNMGHFGGLYDGDKLDGEVQGIELISLSQVSSASVLRVGSETVDCVVSVIIEVAAEVSYDDTSEAIWDNEDHKYYGIQVKYAEIIDQVTAKMFIELNRDVEELTLRDFQFITRDITIKDYFDEGYPYK